jgi:2-polyprenyl-3-methyl-5-hydroxy-6-metoxy-1,4-benzoquinol methylase
VTSQTEFFLPAGYRANPLASADRDGTPYWEHGLAHNDVRYQVPVYRLAARRARKLAPDLVMDIGCGSGDKLAEFFGGRRHRVVGVDQGSAIALARERFHGIEWFSGDLDSDKFWAELANSRPDLVICADVIEHLSDPAGLLRRLHDLIRDGLLILSTPDRARLGRDPLGPPANPRHVREWTAEELTRFVRAHGFTIVSQHHVLPRRYSWTTAELRRLVGRARRGMAVPDRRTCQVLELRRS